MSLVAGEAELPFPKAGVGRGAAPTGAERLVARG